MKITYPLVIILFIVSGIANAQDTGGNRLRISGELTSDERFLSGDNQDWAWNENRLTLKLNKSITGGSKFSSEVWIRNIGLPAISSSSDLYNKRIVDPYSMDIREANIQLYGFLSKNLDIKIGRQIIVWGTADKINPTNNLNPYDMEDVLDFGRHRGSDAISADFYLNSDFSLHGVYIPFFAPANMPVGLFADALNPVMSMPEGMTLKRLTDTILMPRFNIRESYTAGMRLKGFVKGVDFSVSYIRGYDGLPVITKNTFIPVDLTGGVDICSSLSFMRTHSIGADFAADITGIGLWGEAALFIPDKNVIMTNDLSALYPLSPVPVTVDTTIIDKPYVKYIVGGDYNFRDGSYLNLQYLHGFFHEKGGDNMNDYLFLRYEKRLFSDKLKIAPVSGAIIVADWKNIKGSYTIAYLPQISYTATPDIEITLSMAIFDGKGDNLFANLKEYDMFLFNMKYSF
jgi:hypothetical protein